MRRRGFLVFGLMVLWPAAGAAMAVYVVEDGLVVGPFDVAQLRARLGSRTRAAATQVWMQGMSDWAPASQVPALAALVASLPLDPPFDVAKYMIGSWLSDDHPITMKSGAIVGRQFFVFAADGTFTEQAYGSRVSVTTIPGASPGHAEIDSKQFFLNTSAKGTFAVRPGNDGFFVVEMKGTVTDNSSGAMGETQEARIELEFKQLGPNQMRTRYGVNYHKTAD